MDFFERFLNICKRYDISVTENAENGGLFFEREDRKLEPIDIDAIFDDSETVYYENETIANQFECSTGLVNSMVYETTASTTLVAA